MADDESASAPLTIPYPLLFTTESIESSIAELLISAYQRLRESFSCSAKQTATQRASLIAHQQLG
jgi:hypothetical protein